ncbi:hypothetical protein [Citricoccus nitrophenolicus]|uniref:hypothetical protein n=1 Tax=Citricoccus nitrophenolicus TaxID=863575 RepID=UPI0031EDEA85
MTSVMCIAGIQREWARAKPVITNYLARNFMPYTFLGFGLACVGVSPQLIFTDPPLALNAIGGLLTLLAVPFILISMIHWPLFLSPPWYRRWYKRGGRMGNKVPLWDPSEKKNSSSTN